MCLSTNFHARKLGEITVFFAANVFFLRYFFIYLGPKICDIVPLELKELTSVDAFKKGIKKWSQKMSMYAMYIHCI